MIGVEAMGVGGVSGSKIGECVEGRKEEEEEEHRQA